jgi:hypothetical protein
MQVWRRHKKQKCDVFLSLSLASLPSFFFFLVLLLLLIKTISFLPLIYFYSSYSFLSLNVLFFLYFVLFVHFSASLPPLCCDPSSASEFALSLPRVYFYHFRNILLPLFLFLLPLLTIIFFLLCFFSLIFIYHFLNSCISCCVFSIVFY